MSRTGTERGDCPNCSSSFNDCITRTREPRRCCGPCLRFETVHPEINMIDTVLLKIIERVNEKEQRGVMTIDLVAETGLPRSWVDESVLRLQKERRIWADLGWWLASASPPDELPEALYLEFGAEADWSTASEDEQREFKQAARNLRQTAPHLFR